MTWRSIETAPKDGTVVQVRWRFVSERYWREAHASYRAEPKPALFDPLTGRCFAEAFNLTGWMYEARPYLIPGIVEWQCSTEAQ